MKKEYQFKKFKDNYQMTLNGEPLKDVSLFFRSLNARGLSPQTLRSYGYDLLFLFRWLATVNKTFGDINKADLVDFIHDQKDQGFMPRTINRRLVTCESFYWYRFDKPMTSVAGVSHPAPYYKGSGKAGTLGLQNTRRLSKLNLRVKVPSTLIETLTSEEASSYLQEVKRYRDLSIVLLMLMCGLRSCEVLSFKKNGIDFINSQIRVFGKGGKERAIPLPDSVSEVIQKYLHYERPEDCEDQFLFVVLQGARRGLPMTQAGLRSLFRYRRNKSGVHKARPHRWRHSFGTEMARAGVSYQVLGKLMGHAVGSSITNQYIHLSMADIADEYHQAIKRLGKHYDLQKK